MKIAYAFKNVALLPLFSISLLVGACNTEVPKETSTDAPAPAAPANENTVKLAVEPRTTLERFDFFACKSLNDSGCSCSYGLKGDDAKAPIFFASDMGSAACIKINGTFITLTSREGEYFQHLQQRVKHARENSDWIVVPKSGPILYFGAPVPVDANPVDYLSHILLMFEEIPNEVPIRNESEGMGSREIRGLTQEAITIAKARKAEENYEFFEEDLYTSKDYQLILDTEKITDYAGEANAYEGTLTLKNKEGSVLHTQPVSGACGC